VVRDEGEVRVIVEERDATPAQLAVREINGGIYVFDSRFLFGALKQVTPDNEQKEFYLTDVVRIAIRTGGRVAALKLPDIGQIRGVNRPEDMEALNRRMAAKTEG
jgi:bifunctional N-acetylglucosamine-1-phosphate-uridyltransferase/glucosamine-1-phosphate-acetyltransferase GlmU-like protein